MAKQTLEQRMERSTHIYIDDEPYPLTRVHCRHCGDSIPCDYFQLGSAEMSRRMTSFITTHEKCPKPRQVNPDVELEEGIRRAKERNYATRGKNHHDR